MTKHAVGAFCALSLVFAGLLCSQLPIRGYDCSFISLDGSSHPTGEALYDLNPSLVPFLCKSCHVVSHVLKLPCSRVHLYIGCICLTLGEMQDA